MKRILSLVLLFATIVCSQPACRAGGEQNEGGERMATLPSQSTAGFSNQEFRNRRGETMRYRLYVPENYDSARSYPLVLWLHGSGGRGDDLRLIAGADASGIEFLTRAEHQRAHPSFVVAPQCPAERRWDAIGRGEMSNQMRLALEIVESVNENYNIDRARLYVMGISLGGYGVWDIIARRTQMFAAAVPICGGGDTTKGTQISRTPVWAFHGDADQLVPVTKSREMIAAMRRAGGSPRYTEYAGVGHNSWEDAFRETELFTWLFAQRH
jgi:predicted peptidase